MIKFKIFAEPEDDSSQDTIVGLKLEKSGSSIVVKALDKNGRDLGGSKLLEFTSTGKIYRCVGVCGCKHFALDSSKRVVLEE